MSESVFFFPLRTNVKYFETPEGALSLKARVKEALILYDHVVFESGLYVVDMGPGGAYDFHLPSHQLPSAEELSNIRRAHNESEGFSIFIQPDPEKPPQQLLSSEKDRSFQAEFHSLLEEVSSAGIDGAELAELHLSQEGKQLANTRADTYFQLEEIPLPDDSWMVRRQLVRNLFKDLLLVSDLGWAGGIDSLHGPILDQMIRQGEGLQAAPGFSGLEVQVPNVVNLSWEQIAEVRTDPAIRQYRKKVFEAEIKARDMLPDASPKDISARLEEILDQELLDEVEARLTLSGLQAVRDAGPDVVLELAGSAYPPLAPAGAILSVGKAVYRWQRDRRSWLAALIKLRRLSR